MKGLAWADLKAMLHERFISRTALATKDFHSPISLIGEQGMTDTLHVGTDLMRPSCLENTLHKSGIAVALQYPIVVLTTLTLATARRTLRHS